jgi:hypothetical protein
VVARQNRNIPTNAFLIPTFIISPFVLFRFDLSTYGLLSVL